MPRACLVTSDWCADSLRECMPLGSGYLSRAEVSRPPNVRDTSQSIRKRQVERASGTIVRNASAFDRAVSE
jgi:hypothetical protein